MRYFDWDDQNISNDLTPEFEFTKVYKEYTGAKGKISISKKLHNVSPRN